MLGGPGLHAGLAGSPRFTLDLLPPTQSAFLPALSLLPSVAAAEEEEMVVGGALAGATGGLGPATRHKAERKPLRQLLAVDHSARASMKNAASCEN